VEADAHFIIFQKTIDNARETPRIELNQNEIADAQRAF